MGSWLGAQTSYQANFYSIKDGISPVNARQILRDKDGFVWITSDKGLNRYDGNSIYTFVHRPDDPTTIASNSCNGMLEDSRGRLWINTDEGLSLLDRKKQLFTNFYPDTTTMSLLGLNYTQMAEDHNGSIWIGGYYDVLIFDPNKKTFKKSGWFDFAKKAGIIQQEDRNSITQSIVKKSETELWLMTVYGLFSVHTPTLTYTYHPNPDVDDYFAFYINEVDSNGTLWIGTYDQCFYTYRPKDKTWNHHICPSVPKGISNQVQAIKNFGSDTMMILRSDNVFLYAIKTEQFSTFDLKEYPEFKSTGYFSNFDIHGTHLYFLKSDKNTFVHCRKRKILIRKIHIPLSKDFANNHSYITKSGKIIAGDWNKGQVKICDKQGCNTITDQNGNKRRGPLQLYFSGSDGSQYFSTSNAVYRWDEATNKAIMYTNPEILHSVSEKEYRNFVEDSHGNIYIRERNLGIFIIKKGNEKIAYFDTNIKGTSFSALYYDRASKKLWLATEKSGLYIIDPETKRSKNYPLTSAGTIKKGLINDIAGDDKGNVFLMMPARGLMYIQSSDMKAKLLTTFDGMMSDAVRYGLVSPKDALYWFTTEAGIMAFDYRNDRFYTFQDEPDARLFNYRIFVDNDGNIAQNIYPSQIVTLDKSIINTSIYNGDIYLKDVKLFGRNIPSDSVFHLDYTQNNLHFTFGYKDLESSQTPSLQYSINEQDWQLMEEMNINLFNLSNGEYHIKVRPKYNHHKVFSVTIVISPPWWKTWWFYASLTIFILACGYLAYKHRVKTIRKEEYEKNSLKQRIAQIEMTALRAQMNPHFIFNCLNSINRFILINDSEAASEYLTKFSRLIRMILDASREDVVSLDRELEALKLYIEMESMRFQDSFEWNIMVDKHIDKQQVMLPPLLLQPYVENAIWHGLMQAPPNWGTKRLDINIYPMGDAIIIDIIDNGIGRDKAQMIKSKTSDHHKSHGIALTEERLKLLHTNHGAKSDVNIEDLYDAYKKPYGTKVKISLNLL